jgi:hypothetical protein
MAVERGGGVPAASAGRIGVVASGRRVSGVQRRRGVVVSGVFCGVAWIRKSAPWEGKEGRVDVGLASIEDPVYVEMKDI